MFIYDKKKMMLKIIKQIRVWFEKKNEIQVGDFKIRFHPPVCVLEYERV